MKRFSLVRPRSVIEAAKALNKDPDSNFFRAGGIDLFDRLKEGLDTPAKLIELAAIVDDFAPRMRGLRQDEGGHAIGALATLNDLADSKLPKAYEAVQTAAGAAANPGIRNAATVGGNLLQRPRCWYYRDREIQCLKKGGTRCFAIDGQNRYHAILGGGPVYVVHPSSLASPLLALGLQS